MGGKAVACPSVVGRLRFAGVPRSRALCQARWVAEQTVALHSALAAMENGRTLAVWSAFFSNLLKGPTRQGPTLPATAEPELMCTPGPAAEEQLEEIRAARASAATMASPELHSSPGGRASAALLQRSGGQADSAAAWQSGASWLGAQHPTDGSPALWQSACFAEPRVLLDTFPAPAVVAPVRERKQQRSVTGRYCVAPRRALGSS